MSLEILLKTIDGTAIRDYIHILDLINDHVKSIKKPKDKKFLEFNLGTGKGHSVLDVINAYEKVNKVNIDVKFKNKRKGDVPIMFASSKKAKKYLGWKAKKSLNEMCKSAHIFYKNK